MFQYFSDINVINSKMVNNLYTYTININTYICMTILVIIQCHYNILHFFRFRLISRFFKKSNNFHLS